MTKEYGGTVYLGTVGSDTEVGAARDSIEKVQRRAGDSLITYVRATKGYEARQLHFNNFIEGKHDFLFLMDADQIFPADALERLRSHKLPYISGYYLRRRHAPILPVWYEYGPRGKWPMQPMTRDPERGKLTKLGASGWGCILVHREVVLAVEKLLKGEPFVIEDDMDLWPYDLPRVMAAVKALELLRDTRPDEANLYPAMAEHIRVLREEIRPLRVVKDSVGSDLRFPFFAREAGYTLWGDPEVRCSHVLNYPLHPDDYSATADEYRAQMTDTTIKEMAGEASRIRKAIEATR